MWFGFLSNMLLHILVLTINNLKSLMECFTVCVYLKYEKLRLMFQDVFPSLSTAVPFLFRIFSSLHVRDLVPFKILIYGSLKYSDLYISFFHLYKIVSCTRVLVELKSMKLYSKRKLLRSFLYHCVFGFSEF